MNKFDKFVSTVAEEMEKRLHKEIKTFTTLKNNDTKIVSLCTMVPGEHISPSINLSALFEVYEAGGNIKDILDEVENMLTSPAVPFPEPDMSDFDKMKSNIYFILVNKEKNKALLKETPHKEWCDLAIVFRCLVEDSKEKDAIASFIIKQNIIDAWNKKGANVSTDSLYALAKENTPKLFPGTVRNMGDVLSDLLGDKAPKEVDYVNDTMFVVSNKTNISGASAILYDGLLDEFYKNSGGDFYILPSSIHETLLVKTDAGVEIPELKNMVQEVNGSQVAADEFLSDSVYYYDGNTVERVA